MPESAYFRHCEKPTLSPITGKITGTIPKWLNGTLIRNGTGIRTVGHEAYAHLWDGLAVLHNFNIDNGKVTYFNRPLESNVYKTNMEAQRIAVSTFGPVSFHDPCDALFSKLKTDFIEADVEQRGDNCSVNVCYHGDQLYAMVETQVIRRIDPKTLGTIGGALDLAKYVAVNRATAHPHVLENGDVINIGNSFKAGKGLSYAFIRVPPKFDTDETCYNEAKIIAEIPSRHQDEMAYFHSFGIAGDKLIFVEAPLWANMKKFAETPYAPFSKMLKWNPEEKTRIYVVSMTTGEVHPIVYETEDCFTLHHVNGYEEDGQIVVDLSAYDTGKYVPENLDEGVADKVFNSGCSGRRYVLPLNVDGKSDKNLVTLKNTTATAHVVKATDSTIVVNVQPHIFYPTFVEFPRINYHLNGKKYRYFYGNSTTVKPEDTTAFPDPNLLVKVDLETDTFLTWNEPNVITPEPIFVPNPNGNDEDDGIVLVPLLYTNNLKKTTLLILDGKTFKETGRAEFDAEGTVTTTFHGEWATLGEKIHRY